MADKKKQQEEFVVTDKRKFSAEGERLSNAPVEEEKEEPKAEKPPATPPPAAELPKKGNGEAHVEQNAEAPPVPEPPTAEEEKASKDAYRASTDKIDDMMRQQLGPNAPRRPEDFEMSFERLCVSLYMSAMMQLGLLRREGEAPPPPDIIGARQTIDTLAILSEKTKGNLSATEQNLLQNSLFELRMAFLEITNALTRPPEPGSVPPGTIK